MKFPLLALVAAVGFAATSCETKRTEPAERESSAAAYDDQVRSLLETKCLRCHAGFAPAGGWSADSYLGAIGCTASGKSVTLGTESSPPPLLAALDRSDHAGMVSPGERALLASWLAGGTLLRRGGVHAIGFADPRSPNSHGRFLRERGWTPMLDAAHQDACGACHEGAPAPEARVAAAAPNAPSCTSCHREPNAALACGTCHGEGARAYPPRSRCFFPETTADHAHAVHAGPSATHATGLPCSTCHPQPSEGRPAGVHANGYVDVWFDFAVAGRDARFDATNKSCTGTCHARIGGARPSPSWTGEARMTCGDCHSSPPPNHYRGPCTTCHREANADGTALTAPKLHVNGRVDLGDGSGKCGACHGQGDDPWPRTAIHQAHANPKNARPVDCATCHEVPQPGERHPEGRGTAAVRLSGLAARGGRRPLFDPVAKACAGTYCHEGAGGSSTAPGWADGPGLGCGSCHSSPPPPPHPQSATCGGSSCHEGRTNGLALTPAGRLGHVDGVTDRGPL